MSVPPLRTIRRSATLFKEKFQKSGKLWSKKFFPLLRGCALKTATGAGSAVRAASLAMQNSVIPDNSGIVTEDVDETIINMGKISSPGMTQTDRVILNIIAKNQK